MLKYKVRDSRGVPVLMREKAYGAELAKVLARFVPLQRGQKSTGYFVQRNDDNLVMFALTKYVQEEIKS